MGVLSLLHSAYRPKTTRTLVCSTGGITAYFLKGLEVNTRQGKRWPYVSPYQYGMSVTDFTWRQQGRDAIHPTHGTQPGGVKKLGRLWFRPPTDHSCRRSRELQPHSIHVDKDTGRDVLSQLTGVGHHLLQGNIHRDQGSTGGGQGRIARTSIWVDCQVNALPRAECGDLQPSSRWPTNATHWEIPATTNPRSPTRPRGDAEPLPGYGTRCTGGPKRWHQPRKEPLVPTSCRTLDILWVGGPLGPFPTTTLLPQTTDEMVGLPRANTPILVWLRPGIRQTYVLKYRNPRPKKLRIRPFTHLGTVYMTTYPLSWGYIRGWW